MIDKNRKWLGAACAALLVWQAYPASAATAIKPATTKNAPDNKDYRVAPAPSWVKPVEADKQATQAPLPPGAKARRNLLTDTQVNLTSGKRITYQRIQRTALDSSTLREVSEPTIEFNPAYQKLVIHSVSVVREGKRSDRLKDLRVEMMRREQGLEQQMLDGLRTALLMLKDVRVGDVVDVSYSLEGANPIFDGRYSELFQAGDDAPTDRLHIRVEAPVGRQFQVKGIPVDGAVERFEESGKQVLRLQRQNVPAVQHEAGTPPWFKVYPALQVSEYKSWKEVDQWAQSLFPMDAAPSGELASRIAAWKAKGLAPEALLAEVLRFVQDDVRYFSVSLGESSHRPKPAAQTLADRMGDCKDKVLLLNTVLKGLGFDAKPTLVSYFRNKGVTQYLPSHDQFDHVISMVELEGQRYFLDPTIQGQGHTLKGRGYYPYGVGLVVGEGDALQRISPPDFAQEGIAYQQEWDLADIKKAPRLTMRMTARGITAERWRAAIAANGLERLTQSMAGAYVRVLPGLQPVGTPELADSRERNELQLTMRFEHPLLGEYKRGGLELDLVNIELADMLAVPPEARRLTPFMLDQTRVAELKLVVRTPRNFTAPAPAPQQVADKHFSYQTRMEPKGNEVTIVSRFERRGDEVLPADLDAYREKIMKARQNTSQRLRLLLVDRGSLETMARDVDRKVARYAINNRADALLRLLQDQEFERQLADAVLPQLTPDSALALKVRGERAQLQNQMGDFQRGLQDAEIVLASKPTDATALEARGVALIGLNRSADAAKDFEQLLQNGAQGQAVWLAISQYMQGQYTKAEATLRQQLGNTAGEERTFALIWMHLAAERQQAGKGRAAVANELAAIDDQTWPGALLHYLAGRVSRDALLRLAGKDPEQERMHMAEASFFIGQQLMAQNQPQEARPWFEKTVRTQALPYREVTLARLELQRLQSGGQ